MARSIPKVRDDSLHAPTLEGSSTSVITLGSAEWYTWLEHSRSFRFETPHSAFTARQEQRPGGWYWYAYRRRHGKLHIAYLGKPEELTIERLNAVASVLEGATDGSEETRPGSQQATVDVSVQANQTTIIPFPPALSVADALTQPELVPRGNLPIQLTSLVGLEPATATATALLRRTEVRLLSMLGTGGIGKTRLAIEVARELLEDFSDGIYFVALAPLRDPNLVLPTIAHTLSLKGSGSEPVTDRLRQYLRDKHLLLVLDNFEHLMPAAPVVGELLTACPKLKLLVTSREVLHLRAEQQFSVPPLELPDRKHVASVGSLVQYPALDLFMQRARTVKHDFQLNESNAQSLAEICMHLDGLPLAIELAAARIKFLSPQAPLARLDHRLQVLTSGARDLPERQQTLRKTIQWSYELLNAEEQRLFRRLSVFVEGCSLEAIEAVCMALGDATEQVLDGIASLIDKSLLHLAEQRGGEPRLSMLETIREYGLECLHASGEAAACQRAHTLYYLALAEEAEPHLKGAQQVRWWKRVEQEQENLRAALAKLIEQGEGELALRLGGALWWFWFIRGSWNEGWRWLEAALLLPQAQGRTARRAKALHGAGALAHFSGHPAARSSFEESVAISRELGDKRGLAEALYGLAWILLRQNEDRAGLRLLEESLALAREVGDPWLLASILRNLGDYMSYSGDFQSARLFLEESMTLLRDVQDQRELSVTLIQLVEATVFAGEATQAVALAEESLALARALDSPQEITRALYWQAVAQSYKGDSAQAVVLLEESLALAREQGDKRHAGNIQLTLGNIILSWGDLREAETHVQQSLTVFRELRSKDKTAQALSLLGEISRRRGDFSQARAVCTEGVLLARAAGSRDGLGRSLIGLARVAADEGQSEQAARLFGAAEPWLRPGMKVPFERADYERAVEGLRARLGEQALSRAWTEGRTMTPEQALARRGPHRIPTTTPSPAKGAILSPDGLTQREMDVLRLLAQGLPSAQMAEQLVIGLVTVNSHVRSIYSKLGVTSRAAATRYALEHHLL